MKTRLLAVAIISLCGSFLWAQSILDKPLAVVRLTKTEQVGSRLFNKQLDILQKQLGTPLDATKKRQLLESRVDGLLLNQAAERDKVSVTDSEVASAVAQQRASLGSQITDDAFRTLVFKQTGLTWEEYNSSIRDRLLQEKYLSVKRPELMRATYDVTDADISTIYEQQAQKFVSPALIRFSFLSIDTRDKDDAGKKAAMDKLQDFARQVKSGGKSVFDDLVKKSLDNATYTGGDSGYLMKGEQQSTAYFGKDFIEALFAMNNNQISGVMEATSGYYIVMVTDKRTPRLLALDDPLFPGQKLTPREQIRQALVSQKRNEAIGKAVDEIVKALRTEAEITYLEQNFGW